MNDSSKSKNQSQPLEEFRDQEKVIESAARYQRDKSNEIYVKITKDTDGFQALTSFTITLNKLSVRSGPANLLECWIDWSPTDPLDWAAPLQKVGVRKYASKFIRPIMRRRQKSQEVSYPNKLPMIIREMDVVTPPQRVEVHAKPSKDNEKVTVRATKVPSPNMKLKFEVPNVFFRLPGREPFVQKRLTFNIKVLNGCAASNVLLLDHPKSLALRARVDNSEYQSLVLSSGDDYYRRATFFPEKDISVRYTFGTADGNKLVAPGFPPFRAGFAMIGLGFTFLLIQAGYGKLAGVTFGASLIPLIIETFHAKGLVYRSATISDKRSCERLSTWVFSILHGLALIAAALLLLRELGFESRVPSFELATVPFQTAGFVFIMSGAILLLLTNYGYLALVRRGTLQRYMCDRCEKHFWIRSFPPVRLSLTLTLGFCSLLLYLAGYALPAVVTCIVSLALLLTWNEQVVQKIAHFLDLGPQQHDDTNRVLCKPCYEVEVTKVAPDRAGPTHDLDFVGVEEPVLEELWILREDSF
jgi:hypothetical protein